MNLSKTFTETCQLAKETKALHSVEVIDVCHKDTGHFTYALSKELQNWSTLELYSVEGVTSNPLTNKKLKESSKELRSYIERCYKLSALPEKQIEEIQIEKKLRLNSFFKVSEKKQHEIEIVLSAMRKEFTNTSFAIDFAGGVGYLAQALAHTSGFKVISLDFDHCLQQRGETRDRKRKPSNSTPVEYLERDLLKVSPPKRKDLGIQASEQLCSIGLHTCGALSNSQMQYSIDLEIEHLLNFPCCYHRLEAEEQAISTLGRAQQTILSPKALVLATGRGAKDFATFNFSKRVKFFRYLFHLFTIEELGASEMLHLGNSPRRLYQGEFLSYGNEQLERLGKSSSRYKKLLKSFYQNKKKREESLNLVYQNVVRGMLSRPLEVMLVLDRALFLEEHGYQVEVAEYFKPEISPRNIGIKALKNSKKHDN